MNEVPNAITNKFIDAVNELVSKGIVKNRNEICERLELDKTSMSSIMNGRRNIPHYMYAKFNDEYAKKEPPIKDSSSEGYKEKYIALLESQVKNYEMLVSEMKEIKQLLKEIKRSAL